MRGSAPLSEKVFSSRIPPQNSARDSLAVMTALPRCSGITVAAVVMSPWPMSSASARVMRSSRAQVIDRRFGFTVSGMFGVSWPRFLAQLGMTNWRFFHFLK